MKTDTLNKEFSQYGYVCPYFEWQLHDLLVKELSNQKGKGL